MNTGHDARAGARPRAENASIDTSFERLLGRQATESERAHLHRLRDVLGLRDNDAFWSIVMALEHYDSVFRVYPAKLAEATARAVENVRAACAAAAQAEVASVQRALADKVAETSVMLARKLAERSLGVERFAAALAVVVAFGCLCLHAGYELASRSTPSWVRPVGDSSTAARVVARVLSVPAGWMIFALLLPAAFRGVTVGWRLVADPLGERRDRVAGGCLLACCLVGVAACGLILVRLA